MARLFVDVDDTLVRWLGGHEPHPYGHGAETWEPNGDVIAAVLQWKAAALGPVIVWSGGGEAYAYNWAQRLLPGVFDLAMSKQPVVTEDDILIDDQDLKFGGTVIHPSKVREAGELWRWQVIESNLNWKSSGRSASPVKGAS